MPNDARGPINGPTSPSAIALWVFMRMMPESSRWYAANKRFVEAIGALKRVRNPDKDNVTEEIEAMVNLHREEASERWSLKQVWQARWTRRILLIGLFLGFFDQLTGINTAMYYMPKILHAAGFGTADSITLNVISGLASVITFVFPVMIEGLGPVWIYTVFGAINVLALIFYIKFVPETKYSSLEELELTFRQHYSEDEFPTDEMHEGPAATVTA